MFVTFIRNAIRFSTIFLFGSTGEIITEKSGHLNMGTPGIMCMGGIGAVFGEFLYLLTIGNDVDLINPFLCVLFPLIMAIIFGALGGLFFSFLTVTLKCNQNVVGLTLTTFGVGLNAFILPRIPREAGFTYASEYFYKLFPDSVVNGTGWFGQIFLGHGFLVYLAIILAVVVTIVIKKTNLGLSLRAIGENPATADAAGLNVAKYRYIATMIGGAIAALGGLFYIMDYLGGSVEYTIDRYGWMAVALVIFSMWNPSISIFGSFLFGALYIMPSYLDGLSFADKELIKLVPYVVTILVLVATSLLNKRETQPPSALGLTYFREDR